MVLKTGPDRPVRPLTAHGSGPIRPIRSEWYWTGVGPLEPEVQPVNQTNQPGWLKLIFTPIVVVLRRQHPRVEKKKLSLFARRNPPPHWKPHLSMTPLEPLPLPLLPLEKVPFFAHWNIPTQLPRTLTHTPRQKSQPPFPQIPRLMLLLVEEKPSSSQWPPLEPSTRKSSPFCPTLSSLLLDLFIF